MSSVLVVDGYGIRLTVTRGRLVVEDGMGGGRRRRELSRVERSIRRIVVLTDTGTISLDAVRWCADVGITLAQLDRDGRVLLTAAAPGTDDARLRRAQAAAPTSPVGLEITRTLLGAKITGHAALARELLDQDQVATVLDTHATGLTSASDLAACREIEARAANVYFGAWAGSVRCRFAENERPKVPDHWETFTTRRSVIHRSATPRQATTPVNALLNYAYALAEVECRLAALTLGLDPGMGIVHTDKRNRDSLALDLLEAVRPVVERHVLTLLGTRHFTAGDFHETRDGTCRLVPPLTHLLVEAMPTYAGAIAPVAETVAHALATTHPGKVQLRTPLTRANYTRAQTPGARSAARKPPEGVAPVGMPTCRVCGVELTNQTRQLCPTCWPVTRNAQARTMHERSLTTRAAAREAGVDPTQTPSARDRRQAALLAMKAAEADWARSGAVPTISRDQLRNDVLPQLRTLTIRQLQDATGLSVSACSLIRSGKRAPHPRHWDALAHLTGSSPTSELL